MSTQDLSKESQLNPLPRSWIAALLVLVFAVYAPSLSNGFALDDQLIVATALPNGNPNGMTAELLPISDYFTAGYWEGNDGEQSPLFRPITILSYAVTNAAFHGAAFPHHLINVLLHVWATWLVLQLLLRMAPGRSGRLALIGAALFGLHAIHSEVIAGIVGRAELFGFCFGAQALTLFLSGREYSGAGRICRWSGCAVLLLLAFCAKESALAWAPFLWVVGISTQRMDGLTTRMIPAASQTLLVSLVPIGLFFLLRHGAVGDVPSPFPIHYLSNQLYHQDTSTRILTATSIWGFGLWKCLWPTNLTSDYGPVMFEMITSVSDYRFLLSLTVLLGLLGLGVWKFRQAPLLFVGAAGFLGFSFLVSNLPLAIGTIFGERLYYTPSFGIVCIVVWIASRLHRPLYVMIPLGAWLLVSSAVILERNGAWESQQVLMLREASTQPQGLRNRDSYAQFLLEQGDANAATKVWQENLQRDPWFVNTISNYGSYLAATHRYEQAEKMFLDSLKIPLSRRPLHHITHFHLAVLYATTQQDTKSREQLLLAWQQKSAYETIHEPLLTRSQQDLTPEQMEQIIERGERERPGLPTWLLQRGYIAISRKDFGNATRYLKQANAARPEHLWTRWVLAVALIQSGKTSEARPLLLSLRDNPKTPAEILSQVQQALK